MPLKLIAIGGLGTMLSPSAKHLDPNKVKYLRVLDRGSDVSELKQQRRHAWQIHGAQLVFSLEELVGDNAFDGVVICAGKNGDDFTILQNLIPSLSPGKFILHLSTLSCNFVTAAHQFCAKHQLAYVNYPLTGGAKGAENAKMLILASGDKDLYDTLHPMLKAIGVPEYFGEEITRGAAIKLIGHVLVFHGLLGISLATVLDKNARALAQLDPQQVSLFDFLNQGAGGTKQWDVSLRPGLAEHKWEQGFFIRHAVIDAIYAASLLMEKNLPTLLILPLLEVVLLFAYLLKTKSQQNLATQSIAQLIAQEPKEQIDQFIRDNLSFEVTQCLHNCIQALPADLQHTLMLDVSFA